MTLDAPADRIVHPRATVLMTSHNRAEVTRTCLTSLTAQSGVDLTVILNDDGSTDGTAEMASRYEEVRVLRGSGGDYWAGGMRRAWAAMDLESADVIILLNDDVQLDPDSLRELVTTVQQRPECLWGAAVRDPASGDVTYGGNVSVSSLRKMKMRRIEPSDVPVECDALNGNIMLMSTAVAKRLRGLDERYVHGMADYDLSWRAKELGIPSMLAAGTWGTCTPNRVDGTWRDTRLSRRARWTKLRGPKGLPLSPWWHICRRFGGPLWFVDFVSPYARVLIGR